MQHEEDCKHNQGYCPNDIVDVAEKHIDAMLEEIEDPMVHKVAALMIMKRFVEWHSTVAENHLNQPESLAWAEDMGKIKSAAHLFASVSLGANDFVVDNKE